MRDSFPWLSTLGLAGMYFAGAVYNTTATYLPIFAIVIAGSLGGLIGVWLTRQPSPT